MRWMDGDDRDAWLDARDEAQAHRYDVLDPQERHEQRLLDAARARNRRLAQERARRSLPVRVDDFLTDGWDEDVPF